VECSLKCVDFMAQPPQFDFACVTDCVSQGCADARFFVNQVLSCAAANFGTCGTNVSCIQMTCSTQVSACLGATCSQ
jgi:hypothetical protein